MTRLVTTGFESGLLDFEVIALLGAAISTSSPRTGDYCVYFSYDGHYVAWYLYGDPAEYYVGLAWRADSTFGDASKQWVSFRIGGTFEAGYRLLPDYKIAAYRGSTLLATSDPFGPIEAGSWFYNEFYWKKADSGGRHVVKVQGKTVLDFTGDTLQSSTPVDRFVVLAPTRYNYLDDIVLNDGLGTVNNSWPGIVHLPAIRPAGPGDVTQLTPSADANWECVDEVPPNGTDYVYGDTDDIDDYDLYEMANPSDPGDAVITNIVVVSRAKVDSGSGSIAQVIKSGSTEDQGDDVPLTEGWKPIIGVWPTNPDDGQPWEFTDVNGLQTGVKIR